MSAGLGFNLLKGLARAVPRALAGMGITQGTKKVLKAAEDHEIQKFTPREGTLGPQMTPGQRQEMGEQLAQAHITRGQRKLGWSGMVLGIAVGIGVGLMLPATVPFAAAAAITGIAGAAVEGAVGVVAGAPVPEDPKPAAKPETEGAEVTGMVGSNDPSIQTQTDPEPAPPQDPVVVVGGSSGTNVGTGSSTTDNNSSSSSGGCEEETHGGSGCGGTSGGGHTDGGDPTGGGGGHS